MRTTVTLDADTDAAIRRLMKERGLTFKQAVNEGIRSGLTPHSSQDAFRTPTFAMGRSAVPIDKAMRLAAELEDEEIIRKLALRK
ncbi:MAG: antitoxin [Chloroflexota bacterium]